MKTGIVGNKEMDRLILLNTENERDFLNLCIADSYFKNLCDENMFMRRLEKYYPDILKAKPPFRSFKDWYLKNMKAKGELKEKYNFDYNNTGVPVFYINVIMPRNEYESRDPRYIIDRAGNLGYLDVVDYIRNVLGQEVSDSYVLSKFAGTISLENLKVLLSLDVSRADIYNAVLQTMMKGNYVNFKYMVDTYTMNEEDEANPTPANEVGQYAGIGKNEKIIDYFLEKFPSVEAISGVLQTLINEHADPEMIQKYYKMLAEKGEYLDLIDSTRDDTYLFKKSVDEYVKNTKRPSPADIDRLKDILDLLLFDGKEEEAQYLLKLGIGLSNFSLNMVDDYLKEVEAEIPYIKDKIKRTGEMY